MVTRTLQVPRMFHIIRFLLSYESLTFHQGLQSSTGNQQRPIDELQKPDLVRPDRDEHLREDEEGFRDGIRSLDLGNLLSQTDDDRRLRHWTRSSVQGQSCRHLQGAKT